MQRVAARDPQAATRCSPSSSCTSEGLLKVVDEGWEKVKNAGLEGTKWLEEAQADGHTRYTIKMNRKIGFHGGTKGGKEDCYFLRLLLRTGTSEVITGFPHFEVVK